MPRLQYFQELTDDQKAIAQRLANGMPPQQKGYVIDHEGNVLTSFALTPLFATGEIHASNIARAQLAALDRSEVEFAIRHSVGDWSEMEPDEQQNNLTAVRDGNTVLSRFSLGHDRHVYVLTRGDRSVTRIFTGGLASPIIN